MIRILFLFVYNICCFRSFSYFSFNSLHCIQYSIPKIFYNLLHFYRSFSIVMFLISPKELKKFSISLLVVKNGNEPFREFYWLKVILYKNMIFTYTDRISFRNFHNTKWKMNIWKFIIIYIRRIYFNCNFNNMNLNIYYIKIRIVYFKKIISYMCIYLCIIYINIKIFHIRKILVYNFNILKFNKYY